MISPIGVQNMASKLNRWVGGYINPYGMEAGMGKDIVGGLLRATTANAGTAASVYGGAAGAVGGMLSSDRDQSWYTGLAQGAFAGAQISRHGLSGGGVLGAAMGAVYGMGASDTSIMGGAFMGAMAGGPGKRYAGIGRAASQAGVGKMGRAGFGMRAVANAVSRDIGFGWRAGGGKGGAGPRVNRAVNRGRRLGSSGRENQKLLPARGGTTSSYRPNWTRSR